MPSTNALYLVPKEQKIQKLTTPERAKPWDSFGFHWQLPFPFPHIFDLFLVLEWFHLGKGPSSCCFAFLKIIDIPKHQRLYVQRNSLKKSSTQLVRKCTILKVISYMSSRTFPIRKLTWTPWLVPKSARFWAMIDSILEDKQVDVQFDRYWRKSKVSDWIFIRIWTRATWNPKVQ